MRRLILALVITLALCGCATQGVSSRSYTPPSQSPVKNEKVVGRPQAAVWDELVKELSKSFYVINNIERESRIINVSFNSNSPNDYVDCGRSRRTYTQGDKTETYDYAVAERATFKVAGNAQPNPSMISYAIANRVTSLEGRANIYVAPESGNSDKTVVSVNTRYILTVRVQAESFVQHFNGNILARTPMPSEPNSLIFNTNKESTTNLGADTIVCAGRGKLENEILNMIR